MTPPTYDAKNMNRFRLSDADRGRLLDRSWGIELVVRALAGSQAPLLPSSQGMRIDHGQYLAYWHGIHFLAVARLGWRDPGLGFRAWHEQGCPTGDATLDFIASVWGLDGTLDSYMAWATINRTYFTDSEHLQPAPPSEAWMHWARQVRDRPGLEILTGGSNPPHFGTANDESSELCDDGPATLTIVDRPRRRAVYLTGSHGFYDDLGAKWNRLPDVAPRNWHVDVFSRRFGYLGEYRKSRTTGRLHVGKHSIHMLGN